MRLSVLILTHNRPKLFERCIKSVLKDKPDDVEILVNNDSNDITEIPGAKYYYESDNDISKLYRHLFDEAKGEFIYFLEDDDYAVPSFYELINNLKANTVFRYMPYSGATHYFEHWKQPFRYNFQLGQMIFRKDDLKDFPSGNDLQNDLAIYDAVNEISPFTHSKQTIFTQTTDGRDNISFYEYNKDERFQIDEEFR